MELIFKSKWSLSSPVINFDYRDQDTSRSIIVIVAFATKSRSLDVKDNFFGDNLRIYWEISKEVRCIYLVI